MTSLNPSQPPPCSRTIVGIDVVLRHQFWRRFIVNVGILLVLGAFHLRFVRVT